MKELGPRERMQVAFLLGALLGCLYLLLLDDDDDDDDGPCGD